MSTPVLELTDVQKSFGGVPALKGARLEVRAGEIHGLVGENGAGKSTLINIATGVLRPDGGAMALSGEPYAPANPRQAAAAGIAVVHQEADLFGQLSIAENMLLGHGLVRNRAGLIRWPATNRRAEAMVQTVGETFDVRQPALGLSVARRMMSEIAAAVSQQGKVLFLDEPTSSLTHKESANLFDRIRALKAAGVAIVYVSHRLEEILELCDRVTIMRDGQTVDTQDKADLTMDRIVAAMVGREPGQMFHKRQVAAGDVRLTVRYATDAQGAFRDVNMTVRAGEIVGLYGFVGAGRSELGQGLFGLRIMKGEIEIDGKPFSPGSPRRAVKAGIAYLPEDRLVQGVFRNHAVRRNASIAALPNLSVFSLIQSRRENALAESVRSDMRVRLATVEQPIVSLSGGNQQKVVFGRWQATQPKVFILDEPTRGVDVGAKAEIHKLICDLAEQGAAILMISSELPEIMAMSDRVITLSEGRQTGEFNPRTDSQETLAAAAVPRSGEVAALPAESRAHRAGARILQFRELGLLAFILILSGGMVLTRPEQFATSESFFEVLASAALPAIMAQGAMLIICTGGIDISVGSMMGLAGALAAMAAKSGSPPAAAMAIAVGSACGMSLLNGGLSILARIHPIIVTLAGISIYRGVMRIVTDGREIMSLPETYRALADGTFLGIPKICYYVVAVTIVTHVILRYTLTGRRVLALGNSETAARLIGLSKARLTLFVFAFSGVLVGLAAVLDAAYYGQVQANTGRGMELNAIAAAVIGGTNILGGRGSALGTLLGAFLVALLSKMLILLHISPYWQDSFVGGLILIAVVSDVIFQRIRGAQA